MSNRLTQFVYPFALAAGLLVFAATAHAQHGGGPGGPPGGGGPSGGGASRTGMMGGPPPRNDSPNDGRSHNGPQLGLPGRWWDDKHFAHAINIRTDQQHKMDDIFEANKGQLLTSYSNLQHEEQRLTDMKSGELRDESKVFASIDRVAQARADLEKENAHILMQIRSQLDADQLTRLDKEIAAKQ